MRKINPNLLKLAEMTRNPDLKMPLEESFDVIDDSNVKDFPGYIYVPSIKVYVAEKRSLNGKNWFECHRELHKKGKRMLTLHEFVEFLKYLIGNHNERSKLVLDDIAGAREPWRGEWIDSYFKIINRKLKICYLHEVRGEDIIPKYIIEPKGYLKHNRTPGIDLNDWINNPTPGGLPKDKTKLGHLYYWTPLYSLNPVAGFNTDLKVAELSCFWDPDYCYNSIGVHAVLDVVPTRR